jgi:hypothetical protein
MPQLDLFTIQVQIICLIVSLFFIYNFFLKYAISTFDAYLRLKIKKIYFFKSQNTILAYFSMNLKKKITENISVFNEFLYDILKIVSKKTFLVSMKECYKNKLNIKIFSKIFVKANARVYLIDKLLDLGYGKRPHRYLYKYKDLEFKEPFENKKTRIIKRKKKRFKKIMVKISKRNFHFLNSNLKGKDCLYLYNNFVNTN